MSKSEKIGNKKPKTYMHFTATSSAFCCSKFTCLAGDITDNLLSDMEVNTVGGQCFGKSTCAFVSFLNVQVKDLHNYSEII